MIKEILKTVFALGTIGLAVVQAEPVNQKCPVSGKDVDATVTAKHTVVLGFCCEKCQAKFTETPGDEKFAVALKAAAGQAVNTKCPVSGEDIEAGHTLVHEGKTVGFCCDKCAGKFKAEPAKFAEKVKADRPANEKCPVSGKDVDVATAVAHTEEVAFCCEKCQAKFNENPAAVLNKEKAKEKE